MNDMESEWKAWAETLEALLLDQRTVENRCWCHYSRTVASEGEHDKRCDAIRAVLRARPGGVAGGWESEITAAMTSTQQIRDEGRRYWESVTAERRAHLRSVPGFEDAS